jgi:hypothetical protein
VKQLLCRDLRAGDILLKMAQDKAIQWLIRQGQRLAGQPNDFLGHAAIALDTQFVIEAQASGLTASHLAVQNKACGYIVFRPRDGALGRGAATAAKLLFDVHQAQRRSGNPLSGLRYNLEGAAAAIFGGTGRAKSATDFDRLFDEIMRGAGHPFFCSQFVVYVYQWAAQQSGLSPRSVFDVSDAKATPAVLASKLVCNPRFEEAGYMVPGER